MQVVSVGWIMWSIKKASSKGPFVIAFLTVELPFVNGEKVPIEGRLEKKNDTQEIFGYY